ncbi:lipopolysaccharide biosynthesis protein [Mycetocola zhujimingii]|nr:polysaccharide biosynthesis protein [Mycetocola zhujimingii]
MTGGNPTPPSQRQRGQAPAFLMRLAGFSGAPILSAVAPFLVLPVVSRVTGEEGWGDFLAGQSIGMLGMVAIQFGWGVIGPVRVARNPDRRTRAAILRESLWSRLVLTGLVLPVVALVTWLVTGPGVNLDAILVALAMAVGGLTPAWFCIGSGRPDLLMLFDAAPKLAASVIAIPIILATGSVTAYPVLLGVFVVAGVAAHARATLKGLNLPRLSAKEVRGVIRGLVPTAGIDAVGNLYGSTAIPIATVGLSAVQASSFGSTDRVYRVGILAVMAFGNAFQSWVLDPSASSHRQRHRAALLSHVVLGVVGGLGIAILGPWATAVVFGADVAGRSAPSVLFGVAFFCISSSTPFIRNALIPAGRFRMVLSATTAAAVVGVTVMLIGASVGSEAVIAGGVAAAEFTTLVLLAGPALRIMNEPDRKPAQLA